MTYRYFATLLFLLSLELGAQCTLQGYFMLDGNVADSSANANHGTFFGGSLSAAADRFGNPNGAVYFDGTNDYINTFTSYDYQERTVSFWFYSQRNGGINSMLAQDANTLSYGSFSCLVDNSTVKGRAGGIGSTNIQTNLALNSWHQVTLVRTVDSVFYYFDGNRTAAGTSNSGGSAFGAYDRLVFGTNRMRNATFFQGRLDDVKIFDCAFSDSQVDSLYRDSSAYAPLPCLQAYWALDSNLIDSSSNANALTPFGGPTVSTGVNGAFTAYQFDGVNDYMDSYTTYDYEERTVEVWFYPTRSTGVNVVLMQDANTLTYGAFSLVINNGDLRGRAGGTSGQLIKSNIALNQWHHVALVRRQDSCLYYHNGLKTAAALSGSAGSSSDAYDKLVIGTGRERNIKFFQGKIEAVKVHACVLSPQEIDSSAQAGLPPIPCLRGYWTFDNTTNDSSQYANHAQVFGGTATYGSDRFGNPNGAYLFDGIDDYLNTLETYDYEERTVSFWINTDRIGNDIVISQDDDNLSYGGLSAGFGNGDLNGRAGGNGSSAIISNASLNTWYHVVMVRTATTNYYYLDGNLVATSASNTGGSAFQAYDKLIFGVHRSRNQRFFKGKLDDVYIAACPMDSNEVDSLYQAQVPINLIGLPNDTTLCPGASFQINMPLNPRISYLWDNNSTGNIRVINQPGTYWLRSSTSTDTLIDTLVVDFYDPPQVWSIDTLLCGNASITVDYLNRGVDSLRWSDGDTSRQRSFSSGGLYTTTLYWACGTVEDTVRILDGDSLQGQRVDTVICASASVNLGNRSAGGLSFSWSTGATASQISVSTPGLYWSRVMAPCDTVVDSFYVELPEELPASRPADTIYLCERGDSISIGFNPHPDLSYRWSDGLVQAQRYVSRGGLFTLTVENGCALRDYDFEVIDLSRRGPLPFADTSICLGNSIFQDFNQWPVTAIQVNGAPLNNGSFQFSQPGAYLLQYTQPCGTWVDTFYLDVKDCDCQLALANAFSPNDDLHNNQYLIKSSCEDFDYDLQIFNRWGILVFQNESKDDFWDGTFRGQPAPPGVFVYKIIYRWTVNGRSSSRADQGTIRLIR